MPGPGRPFNEMDEAEHKEISKKGGHSLADTWGIDHMKEMAKKGGDASGLNFDNQSKAGKKGGKAVAKKLGKKHMSELGKAGARARKAKKAAALLAQSSVV